MPDRSTCELAAGCKEEAGDYVMSPRRERSLETCTRCESFQVDRSRATSESAAPFNRAMLITMAADLLPQLMLSLECERQDVAGALRTETAQILTALLVHLQAAEALDDLSELRL